MRAAGVGLCFVLLVLSAARWAQAAPPETPASGGVAQIQFDIEIVELRAPVRSLIAPSQLLKHEQFPLAGVLTSATYRANYLNYLERLEKRDRVRFLYRPKGVALSGQRITFHLNGERACPVPRGLGSVGIQFEDFGVQVGCMAVLLPDGAFRLDVETEQTSTHQPEADRRAIRGVKMRPGQSLLLAEEENGYLFLITPSLSRQDGPSQPATTRATLSDSIQEPFRALRWRLQELEADVKTRWDEVWSGFSMD